MIYFYRGRIVTNNKITFSGFILFGFSLVLFYLFFFEDNIISQTVSNYLLEHLLQVIRKSSFEYFIILYKVVLVLVLV